MLVMEVKPARYMSTLMALFPQPGGQNERVKFESLHRHYRPKTKTFIIQLYLISSGPFPVEIFKKKYIHTIIFLRV